MAAPVKSLTTPERLPAASAHKQGNTSTAPNTIDDLITASSSTIPAFVILYEVCYESQVSNTYFRAGLDRR